MPAAVNKPIKPINIPAFNANFFPISYDFVALV